MFLTCWHNFPHHHEPRAGTPKTSGLHGDAHDFLFLSLAICLHVLFQSASWSKAVFFLPRLEVSNGGTVNLNFLPLDEQEGFLFAFLFFVHGAYTISMAAITSLTSA